MEESGKLLFVTYAFPPLHVAVSPCVVKVLIGLSQAGYRVDVVCASRLGSFAEDKSLLGVVNRYANSVECVQVSESSGIFAKFTKLFGHWLIPRLDGMFYRIFPFYPKEWGAQLYGRIKALWVIDVFDDLHDEVVEAVCQRPLEDYNAILSWSPFHSVNRVMATVKRKYTNAQWIAHFSDPWAGNPLDETWQSRCCAAWNERSAVKCADFVIHSSERSLSLMRHNRSIPHSVGSQFIPHAFDESLYPVRPKARNEKFTFRYVGTLFGQRTPEFLFRALVKLMSQRPTLADLVRFELVGSISQEYLCSDAAKALVGSIVFPIRAVDYVKSLELMYDADANILIEANARSNLFVPSKLSDYIGAGRPILALAPEGPIRDVVSEAGGWVADAQNVESIFLALSLMIDSMIDNTIDLIGHPNENRDRYSNQYITREYLGIVRRLSEK